MAKWRGLDIDEMEALIKGEDDEGLLMQARGWECLHEVYDDQAVLLTNQKAELEPKWTSKGGQAYLDEMQKLIDALQTESERAKQNASALRTMAAWIGAAQTRIEEIRHDLDKEMKVLDENQVSKHDADVPERATQAEAMGMNDQGAAVMDELAGEIEVAYERFWRPEPENYSFPTNAVVYQPGSGSYGAPGSTGTPGAPSPPAAPVPPTTPPPVTAPTTTPAPGVPGGRGTPNAPGAPGAPGAPRAAAPGAPRAAAPGTPNSPGAPLTPATAAVPPSAGSPATPNGAPGKPGTGRLAPPFGGASRKAPPRQTGRPGAPTGPEAPASQGQQHPGQPPHLSKSQLRPGRGGQPGKPASASPGGSRQATPPTLGAPRPGRGAGRVDPAPRDRVPHAADTPRVTRPGATPPVLSGQLGRRAASQPESRLGVPPAMRQPRIRGRGRPSAADDHRGVIRPPAPPTHPRLAARETTRPATTTRGPEEADYLARLRELPERARPDVTPAPRPDVENIGRVLGAS